VAEYAYYIGYGFAALVNLIVGVRLYTLSVRNAQTPDRVLSVTFLFWALSYLMYGVPWVFLGDSELIPPLVSFSSWIIFHLGTIAFAVFTRAVFRSQERWAWWLVAGMVGCLVIGEAGSVWVGDWLGEQPLSNSWWWMTRVGSAAPYFWMGAEGFAHYVKARRRRQLGLCTPLVCNRYLLWGLAGALWLILDLVVIADYLIYAYTGTWAELMYVAVGWLEAIPGGIIWLVFFPPSFYRNWISKLATIPDSAEKGSPHGG
jgi:hypothetical protein